MDKIFFIKSLIYNVFHECIGDFIILYSWIVFNIKAKLQIFNIQGEQTCLNQ
jgi:hypothetical protein